MALAIGRYGEGWLERLDSRTGRLRAIKAHSTVVDRLNEGVRPTKDEPGARVARPKDAGEGGSL